MFYCIDFNWIRVLLLVDKPSIDEMKSISDKEKKNERKHIAISAGNTGNISIT